MKLKNKKDLNAVRDFTFCITLVIVYKDNIHLLLFNLKRKIKGILIYIKGKIIKLLSLIIMHYKLDKIFLILFIIYRICHAKIEYHLHYIYHNVKT